MTVPTCDPFIQPPFRHLAKQTEGVRAVCRYAVMLLASLAVMLGCASVETEYTPYSATSVRHRPVLWTAVRAYEGDLELLQRAGATRVGTLTGSGNAHAGSDDLLERASADAARAGGTHFIAIESARVATGQSCATNARSSGEAQTAGRADTDGSQTRFGMQTNATSQTQSFTSCHQLTAPVGTYLVVRVPWERLWSLPPELRPVPGRDFPVGDQARPSQGAAAAPSAEASQEQWLRIRREAAERAQRQTQQPRQGPASAPSTPPVPAGCTYDTQCKGERICRDGTCVDPEPVSAGGPTDAAAPATSAGPQ